MKIGIYGGTFNPIHLGHMAAAKFAIEYLKLDRLYLVPVGIPPHKELAEGTPALGTVWPWRSWRDRRSVSR